MILYTYGYNSERGTEELKAVMAKPGAVLVDVRFSPWGRPGTRKMDFERQYPRRYLWVKALGNENYKGGEIRIHQPAAGIRQVLHLMQIGRTVVLMCACPTPGPCHRSVVAQMIRDAYAGEMTITHLGAGPGRSAPKPEPPGLFG